MPDDFVFVNRELREAFVRRLARLLLTVRLWWADDIYISTEI